MASLQRSQLTKEQRNQMPRELACRKCLAITQGKVCPVCGSEDLSENWKGLVILFQVEGSDVASVLALKKPGRYALQVS